MQRNILPARSSALLTLVCCIIAQIPERALYDIQGTAKSSSYNGEIVKTSGIVTADFQDSLQLSGYFLQDSAGDGDSTTSDGIFVYDPGGIDVNPGDYIEIEATVAEYFGLTELKDVSAVSIISAGHVIEPVSRAVLVDTVRVWEHYEGMLVTLLDTMHIAGLYNFNRYGQIVASGSRLPMSPTQRGEPAGNNPVSAGAVDLSNGRNRLVLDDGSSKTYQASFPGYANIAALCAGGILTGVSGVIDFAFGKYRLHPVSLPHLVPHNSPGAPVFVDYRMSVACFNVHNYFITIDNGTNGARGADSEAERNRQRSKLASALFQLQADIFGLVEVENNGDTALIDLINALNDSVGRAKYAAITGLDDADGDRIKVGIAYNHLEVAPAGSARHISDPLFERAPLVQRFTRNATPDTLLVVVVHLKSKSCRGATGLDEDQNDYQGCYNHHRTMQVRRLIDSLERFGREKILIMGDFNAYPNEAPVKLMESSGFSNRGRGEITYEFDGAFGQLDYIFVNDALMDACSDGQAWNINSRASPLLDYNLEHRDSGLFSPGPCRSSDHDPIVAGLFAAPGRIRYVDYLRTDYSPSHARKLFRIDGKLLFPGTDNGKLLPSVKGVVVVKNGSGVSRELLLH
ncbi:MAG: ExeM/NucH family extracellular endonuclease [Chitinivibrionales bacterium]|nr:ExeM/NucH family extracellular endonuclease [Chitinivibrionales bacterium]